MEDEQCTKVDWEGSEVTGLGVRLSLDRVGSDRFRFWTMSASSGLEANTSTLSKLSSTLFRASGTGLGAIAFGENGSRSVAKALVIQKEGETCEFYLH